MKHMNRPTQASGFVLIEALVALLIIAAGLLGIAKITSLSLVSSGDSRGRAVAIQLAEQQLESMRNSITQSGYNTSMGSTPSYPVSGIGDSYNVATTVSQVSATSTTSYQVNVAVTMTDLFGGRIGLTSNPTVTASSVITWDNPSLSRETPNPQGSGNGSTSTLKTPTGIALPGDQSTVDCSGNKCQSTGNGDGLKIKQDSTTGETQLVNSSNQLLLYLPPGVNGAFQLFTVISGNVYVDQAVNGFSMSLSDLTVRLSSQGYCATFIPTSPTPNNVQNDGSLRTSSNSNTVYTFVSYTCYVGKSWYGNIGIWNGGNQTPKICVGDPSFNVSNAGLVAATAVEGNVRSYRGFEPSTGGTCTSANTSGCLSAGVLDNTTYPSSGKPQPSSYPTVYSVTANSTADHFTQHFLVTKSNQSCTSRTALVSPASSGPFYQNAGGYFCISPDDTGGTGVCPATWPNFTAPGTTTTYYTVTVTLAGTGTGTVTTNAGTLTCANSTCTGSFADGTTLTLTPSATAGSTFASWGGACSGTSTCTLTISGADQSATATFNVTGGNELTVIVSGLGSVASSPTGISCSSNSTCNANYASSQTVTLTATPISGNVFSGWSGAVGGTCSGTTNPCTVSMSQVQSVTAMFSATYALTVTNTSTKITGTTYSGTVTSNTGGINCGATCSATINSGTSVTLTAAPGTATSVGWTGPCTGSLTSTTCSFTMSSAQNVTATFYPSTCSTSISGGGISTTGGTFTITNNTTSTTNPSGDSCSKSNGNNANYSCTLADTGGSSVTISYTVNSTTVKNTVTTNCQGISNVNLQ